MLRALRWPGILVWPGLPLLYLLLPGHPFGLLPGLPLGELGLALGLALGLCAWCGGRPSGVFRRWLVVTLVATVVLKVLLGSLALPYGLTATYLAGAGQPERSTEWRLEGASRVDKNVDFMGDQFPVHFFNDFRRFNFYT